MKLYFTYLDEDGLRCRIAGEVCENGDCRTCMIPIAIALRDMNLRLESILNCRR